MPEGHTLRRLADGLQQAFVGEELTVSSPQGRFAAGAALLDGTRLEQVESAGKHLFCWFAAERGVHVHLGLVGRFDLTHHHGTVPPPGGQVRLRLTGAGAYADLRGAMRCALVTPAERDTVLAGLGPDPLRTDADPEAAWRRVRRSDRPIGELLTDQAVLAGVGNVYRAEVLFRQRIHPARAGRTVRHAQFRALWEDLVVLMADGVGTGRIDTVRDEHTPAATGREPRRDDHGGEVYVYRRAGEPCHVCGARVRTGEVGGRRAFWCARCQRPPRAAPVR